MSSHPSAQSGTAAARPDRDAHRIRSYARRGSRFNARQQQAWDEHAARWVIPIETQTAPGFRLQDAFARAAPLVVEIGSGVGEAIAPAAVARANDNFVGFEVWHPGVAETVQALAAVDIANVRLSTLDAVWCFEHLLPPASVKELWTFFPDPWPKARHHKRRLINPDFATLAASRLVTGGVWRLATDWSHYAEQMREVLDAEPTLNGGVTERYRGRPLTRFERRGMAAGRSVIDLTYQRP